MIDSFVITIDSQGAFAALAIAIRLMIMINKFTKLRPNNGACLLDFYEVWLWHAIQSNDSSEAYKWAKELAHWALLMNPELAPMPHNVILGDN